MRNRVVRKIILGISLALPFASINAQQAAPSAATTMLGRAPMAATAPTSVPALVPYSSAAVDGKGKPLAGETSATFLIYKDQQGGEPLFTESQIVAFDEAGHYKVQLGASNPNGLPSDLFATGEARWLEVQIAGQQPEPRVLLASVPYAMKAADAATLGGLPASAFALAASNTAVANATPAVISPDAATTVTTTGGTANQLAKFSGANTIVNSTIFDNGTQVGIGTTAPTATLTVAGTATVNGNTTVNGQLVLPAAGTATPSVPYDSQFIKFTTSAYNSSTKSVVPPRFQLDAVVTGNDTPSPSATLELLASANSAAPTPTGLYFNTDGTINFAPKQTFPIAAGPQGPAGPAGPQGPAGPSGTAGPDITVSGTITAGSLVSSSTTVNGNSTYNGQLVLPATGTATAANGYASQFIKLATSAYNSSTKATVPPRFQLQAEVTGNDTTAPNATLNLLASAGSTAPVETGFYINTDGTIHFAPNQTFDVVSPGGVGVTGTSAAGVGIEGSSTSGIGIQGGSSSGSGVYGGSNSGNGVAGTSGSGNGVQGGTSGSKTNTAGVYGYAGSGGNTSGFTGIAGVWGDTHTHVGVYGTSDQAAGVLGQSANGAGVQGSSTSANGVYGFSSKTSGVHGETQSASTGDAAVYGGSDSVATGVIGVSTNGTGVQGISTNSFGGRFSNSSNSAAVYATNAASSGGSALFGTASGTYGIGVYANATAGGGTGVLAYGDGNAVNGTSNGDVLNTAGVLGVAGYRTGTQGIAGVWGDAAEHVGVIGSSIDYSGVYAASSNSYGLQASSANGTAVYAVSGSTANPYLQGPIAVWGDITGSPYSQGNPGGVNSPGAAVIGTASALAAGYFTNNSDIPTVTIHNYGDGDGVYSPNVAFRALEASTTKGTCGFGGNGDMTCTGQVKALANTGNGARTVETYSMQSPENWMEDFGSGTLQSGVITVSIDPAFAETVSGTADFHVFLTPRGDSKGLYVTNATATSFEVHESGGGTSSIGFDYRIVAKRKGYETQRMVDVTEAMNALKARNDLQAEQSRKPAK